MFLDFNCMNCVPCSNYFFLYIALLLLLLLFRRKSRLVTLYHSEPLPGFSPANRKHITQTWYQKSDYRLEGPLNISVTAKCTIKTKAKGVNVGSQSPAKAKFRNYTALLQTQSPTPRESIKGPGAENACSPFERWMELCVSGALLAFAGAKPLLLYS